MNDEVINGFARAEERSEEITIVRGRPYRKNDQCFVEQKNNTHVREFFGYGRLDWEKVVDQEPPAFGGRQIHLVCATRSS